MNCERILTPSEAASAEAIDALDGGGRMVLPEMDLMLDRGIELRSNVELAGQGDGTVMRKGPGRVFPLSGYHNYGGLSIDIELWADSMKKVFTEYKKHRPYMGTDTVKYAALVVSQQTRDFARHQGLSPFWDTLEGINEIHNQQHLLLDVIFDDSLVPEELSKYAVVLMPNVICLSDAQCEALRGYVSNGGVLIAAMETSLYDEWGNRREDFALSDLFGVHYESTDRLEGGEPLILVPQTEELNERFGRLVAFTGPSVNVKRADDGDAEVLFTRSERQTLNGLWLGVDEYDSDKPAIVRKSVGEGTVYYLSADLGQAYLRTFLPQVAELLGHFMRTAATPPVEFEASKALEVTAHWLDEKKMAVHLVNCTALLGMPPVYKPQDSEERRPFLFQMAPLADIGIRLNEGTIARATAAISGTTLDVKDHHLHIPSVGHGEVVVVELRK